jgi:TusA-related sulfurtransferase
MAEILLDVRDLEPPEPLEKAMDALCRMQPGDTLRMLIHREPCLLYDILRREGCRHQSTLQDDGSWTILITRA